MALDYKVPFTREGLEKLASREVLTVDQELQDTLFRQIDDYSNAQKRFQEGRKTRSHQIVPPVVY
ncbi:MAG TPA: hypothetical protein VJK03_00195 [Candidatus Nanoarchaeia archaeon]|nr:hypothetical protein [Candidatus Nanoarchaeia archaeon]